MQRKKILYVITKGNWGGAQRYVFDLATSIPAILFEVLVAMGEGTALEEKLATAGIRTVRLSKLKETRRLGLQVTDKGAFFELFPLF